MTKRYLERSAKRSFFLFMLGIPMLIWIYSICIELNNSVESSKRLPSFIFKSLFGYSIIYSLIIPFLFFGYNFSIHQIMPFHLVAMLSNFLLILLAARSVIIFEKCQGIQESNILGVTFSIWFCPIGVWELQPKFNKYAQMT